MPRRRFCVAAAIVAAVLTVPITAIADNLVNTRTPFTLNFFNPCTGELFAASGEIHTVSDFTIGPDGRLHEKYHSTLHGVTAKGVITGAKYVVQQQTNEHTNADADGAPSTQTLIFREHFVRTGENGALIDDDDFFVYFHLHMTVNAQGMPTSFKMDSEEDPCR